MTLVSPLSARRPRIALYSHDTCGLGHTRRNLRIAQALATAPFRADVLMLTGARESSAFPIPAGVDLLSLPALFKESDGKYRPRHLSFGLDNLIDLRGRTIRSALESFEPDLFIVDNAPRGAMGELDDALRALRTTTTRCVLGLRDVLDAPEAVAREWAAKGYFEAADATFDAIWVYGDPTVYAAADEYGFPSALRERLTYTGYLDPTESPLDPLAAPALALAPFADGRPLALCAVGGGQDGGHVVRAFAETRRPEGMAGLVLTGPFMDDASRAALDAAEAVQRDLHIARFSTAPAALYRRADRVLTMGGYNTVLELLAIGARPLVVPRERPRAEQRVRAERLADLGLLDWIAPDAATPEALGDWLHSDAPAPTNAREALDFGGLRRIVDLATGLLPHVCAGSERTPARISHA